jgi:hypothetical protein
MLVNYYDSKEGRLVLPTGYSKEVLYEQDWNSIYPDCQDDIERAFGLNLSKVKEMHQLNKKERNLVLEKLKKFSRYPDAVMPGEGIKDFADEFAKVLAEFIKTQCWIFTDAKGEKFGVRPPKGFFGVMGVMAMPWNLMRIDYDAQRWTDIPHIAKILMKFDGQMAMGITARITVDGKHVDVNEGRHGAMLIALTGAPYCWGRAIASNNRGKNFDIFELLNIIPKPTELYDEFRIKEGRARLYVQNGEEIKRDVGGRIEDRDAYDLGELNHNHDVRFVPSSKKKGGKKELRKGDAFRVDKFYDFFQDGRYCFKDETGRVVDTYLSDAYTILRDVFYEGYMPHESAWAICELFKQTAEVEGVEKLSDIKRSKMRKVLITTLGDEYRVDKFQNGHKQAEAFYGDFTDVRKRVDDSESFAGYIASNNFVEYFLATAIYSMIQNCDLVKATDKSLFAVPKLKFKQEDKDGNTKIIANEIRDSNGDLFSFSTFLTDPKAETVEGFDELEEDEAN